jgi:ribosomal protein S18 acetylase RimI-like enzyme
MISLSEISDVRHLIWDSEFFGVQTAEILPRQLNASALKAVLESLWAAQVGLVYWAADPDDPESAEAAAVCVGLQVDTKRSYGISAEVMLNEVPSSDVVVEYDESLKCGRSLEDIAIDCGRFSRFRIDPRIPDERCFELYKQWIRNSVNRSFADGVLVSRSQGKISGFVTVLDRSGTGSIGLLGVGEEYRGQGLGRALVGAALTWFLTNGCSSATVVTQARNHAACKLYESTGFSLIQTDNYYHFWNPAHDSV